MNCPICEKAGLPENAHTCPQCNSDLSGFLLLQKIGTKQQSLEKDKAVVTEKLQKNKVISRNTLIFSNVIFLFLIAFSLWFSSTKQAKLAQVAENRQKEKDSLKTLLAEKQELVAKTETENQVLKNQQKVFKYGVRKGDNLIKIARFFYGSAAKYREIMKENNLQEDAPLLTGDTLIIKLKN